MKQPLPKQQKCVTEYYDGYTWHHHADHSSIEAAESSIDSNKPYGCSNLEVHWRTRWRIIHVESFEAYHTASGPYG